MSSGLCICGCEQILTGRQKKYASSECSKREGRNDYLVARYGITLLQWVELFEYQGGVCAVCRRPPKGRRLLVVDHEHNGGPSGRVRGLICSVPCNLRVVAKHKDGSMLRAAADYLDNPPAVQLFGEVIAPGRPKKKRQPRRRKR